MTAARLQVMRCTYHDFAYAHERLPAGILTTCPRCAAEEAKTLRDELAAALAHRDLLLRAIDLKRTLSRKTGVFPVV